MTAIPPPSFPASDRLCLPPCPPSAEPVELPEGDAARGLSGGAGPACAPHQVRHVAGQDPRTQEDHTTAHRYGP
jgi:hypothetical protein